MQRFSFVKKRWENKKRQKVKKTFLTSMLYTWTVFSSQAEDEGMNPHLRL